MPKSNVKLTKKYKENFEVLKKNYEVVCQKNIVLQKNFENVCQKNAKFAEMNGLFHIMEWKWKEENGRLQQENSHEVSKLMKIRNESKEKDNKINNLKNEIKQLREKLREKEMEEMKEEIPNDF